MLGLQVTLCKGFGMHGLYLILLCQQITSTPPPSQTSFDQLHSNQFPAQMKNVAGLLGVYLRDT